MARPSDQETAVRRQELARWAPRADAIVRKFTLKSFRDAVAFVVRLAFDAEAMDHHPDIRIDYRRVTLSYSTHSEGGLTEKDFTGAKLADACATAPNADPAADQ